MRRRDLLAGVTALAALAPLAACATAPGQAPSSADARLLAMLDRHAETLDGPSGPGGLSDASLAARAQAKATNAARLAELQTIDRAALSPSAAIDYDTAHYVYRTMDDQYGRYGFSDINLRPSPYPVSQMNGGYYWLPDGIGTRSPMGSPADADRYVAKLEQFAVVLDQETEQLIHEAGQGVIPPDFILEKTTRQIAVLRDTSPAENPLLSSALTRAAAAGLTGVDTRAVAVFNDRIRPALTRQIAALDALKPRANSDAGIWAKPDGEAYYVSGLHSNTTAEYAPGELHQLGLTWVRELSEEMDALMRAQGLTEGSVADRMAILDQDPRFLKPSTDEGRQAVIDFANAHIDAVRPLLPRAFTVLPDYPVEVRRVSPAIEAGAPGGFYSASSDPNQPSVIFLNLRLVEENTLWRTPTLLHHEGIPGHHFQASVMKASGGMSAFRRAVRFSAWTEGWALYAEQLAAEIGAYDSDPFGRIGYLQGQLFRACRVVVDTGIHHARWTRREAIDWMVANAGELPEAAEREIDRYCVYPGQACSFMVGKQGILAARAQAASALGDRYDLRAFNDMVLASGPLPVAVLQRATVQWAERLNAA